MRKIGKTRKVSLTLNERTWELLEIYAKHMNISMSEAIRFCIYEDNNQRFLKSVGDIAGNEGTKDDE